MPLRMKSLRIQGFKAIGDATLLWHPQMNVITGPNNSGKTTVLEALSLWVESFDRICFQAGKAISSRGVRRNDWYLATNHVHHSEVVSVRSPDFEDLFHGDVADLCLTATLFDDVGDFEIPLSIRKARGFHYEFSCTADGKKLNPRLNQSCQTWPRPFRVLFASPVAAVQTNEEFLTPGKTADMVRQRRSAEVLRNRIHRLHSWGSTDFERFVDDVSRVLTGSPGGIEIGVHGNPNSDVRAQVLARSTSRDRFRDISLLGSGSLQVIEVLLNLYLEKPADLDIVLLDEPDSHIHRDIQRRLLEVIEEKAEHVQVFVTTHNESLLRNAGWDRVFHLEPAPAGKARVFRPVASERLVATGRQHGLLASPIRNVLSSVGAETALDFLNALEADYFLLVEGSSDAVLINRMFDVARLGGPAAKAMYWSLNGIDSGLRSLASLRVVLEGVRNDRSLWEKAFLVLDRDLLTGDHANALVEAIEREYGLRAAFWEARTVEAVLLSGGPSSVLARLLAQVGVANNLAGLDPQQADVACKDAWTQLGERLKEEWNDPDLARLHGALKQRRELIADAKLASTLRGWDMGKLQASVVEFHRQSIADSQYWKSASKQDVAAFVGGALEGMGVSRADVERWRTGPNWFQAVVAELRGLQGFPALRTMRDTLK